MENMCGQSQTATLALEKRHVSEVEGRQARELVDAERVHVVASPVAVSAKLLDGASALRNSPRHHRSANQRRPSSLEAIALPRPSQSFAFALVWFHNWGSPTVFCCVSLLLRLSRVSAVVLNL